MPIIDLTDYCDRGCCYCPSGLRACPGEQQRTDISHSDFVAAVDFLADAGESEIVLAGGEPTLHPQFVDFCTYLLDRGLLVTTFTNGCPPKETVDRIGSSMVPDRMHFSVNVTAPADRQEWETERQEYFLTRLGSTSGLSFRIYRADTDLGFLFDHIERYGLRRYVRVGVAHPVPGTANELLPPADLKRAQSRLATFVRQCDERDIAVTLECGLTLCGFTDGELGAVSRAHAVCEFACGPMVEIRPDLRVWSCLPLSCLEPVWLHDFTNLVELKRHFRTRVNQLTQERQHAGVFTECSQCSHRMRSACTGGCMAHALAPDRGTSPRASTETVRPPL